MTRKKHTTRSRRAAASTPAPYAAIFCLLLTCFLSAAVLTFSSADWPNPHVYPHAEGWHNACGRTGAWVSYQLINLLGLGVYPLLMFSALGSLLWITRGPLNQLPQRLVGVAVLVSVMAAAVFVVTPESTGGLPLGYGGALGHFFGGLMHENFSSFGAFLVLAYCGLAGMLFTVDGFWSAIVRSGRRLRDAGGSAVVTTRKAALAAVSASTSLVKRPAMVSGGTAVRQPIARPTGPTVLQRASGALGGLLSRSWAGLRSIKHDHDDGGPCGVREVKHPAVEPRAPRAEQKTGERPPVPAVVFRHGDAPEAGPEGCYPAKLDDWLLPPVAILDDHESTSTVEQEQRAREKAKVLDRTLRDFRVDAQVVEIETGPVITMFELSLAPGVKVSQIMALANDVARALRAPAVRVVAPIPGKNTVGIEVPRIDREKVRLKELILSAGHRARDMHLPLFLGKDASGNSLVYDLTKMPHMLIAGTTGSGKSVCINSIIMSLLMTQRPDRVKMILVDPKMVELSAFKEVPHLMAPIVTDMQRAAQILEWACTKMDERYALFAEAGVRNIAGYNRLSREEIAERLQPTDESEEGRLPVNIPYIVMIIDELADMMMTSKDVEHHLARLAQKSRAVGVHIVVATQRPEARVVTGLIKSNLPCRVGFRVAARMDSRIVLDQNGAEVLLGQGDMLFLPPGSARLLRAQGTFMSDGEIRGTVRDLCSKGASEFHPELMRMRGGGSSSIEDRDELFDDAVRIILETQRGSVSLLQRRLTIGYARASRIVDQIADAGIVGEYKGSQAREVLMTLDEWEAMQNSEDPAADRHGTGDEQHASDFDDDPGFFDDD